MIQPKKYLPVREKIFYTPLIKENLRLDFSSSEYKLSDLPLLAALMLRDGKTPDDIAAVTMLQPAVVQDVISELKNQGMIEGEKLSDDAQKILRLSDYINAFNLNTLPIFFDALTESPLMLHESVRLEKFFDAEKCAAVVKNFKRVSDFAGVSNFVKRFLIGHGTGEFIDMVKVFRPNIPQDIFFAARQIRYLPVVGKNNFKDLLEISPTKTILAELPVRKFKADTETGEWKFCVDLLLGTIFQITDDEELNSQEVFLSFKPNPEFESNSLNDGIRNEFNSVVDEGIFYIKIFVAEEIAGDFL